MPAFDFGANWEDFSKHRLDEARVSIAVKSLETLLGRTSLAGDSVLDIGCGSGLFSVAAAQMGAANVVGIDINPLCIEVSEKNRDQFRAPTPILFRTLSVLDEQGMDDLGDFDLVYAWGSLHHTGRVWEAIRLAAQRVSDGGTLVLAIYNEHITSPIWRRIKFFYNRLPGLGKRLMALAFTPVIFFAKLLVTGQNPLEKERGMSFWFDVIDWIGGYPYEYAKRQEVEDFVSSLGFRELRFRAAQVPTGCNEFIFQKNIPTAPAER